MSDLITHRPDPLRDALLESRQRWRDLVSISADIAFETDARGHFVFLSPDEIIGWRADALLDQPSDHLLPADDGPRFNPFQAEQALRTCRVWLRRPDGNLCWMSFSVAPLVDAGGRIVGARGVARDVTEFDRAETAMARALRRSELIDHIMWQMRTEVMAPRMMLKALQALVSTLGAHGAIVLRAESTGDEETLLYEVGGDQPGLRQLAARRLTDGSAGPLLLCGPQGQLGALCATPTRFGENHGVMVWREVGHRGWDGDELALLAAAAGAVRILLEQGTVQREMARQARTDGLTGLLNRRAFDEDLERRLDRLERESLPGSLMFIDIDGMKALNDQCGHEAGDALLRAAAALLRRASRPGDLVARLGGDEFVLWFDGMDHLAAAERAERICAEAPAALGRAAGQADRTAASSGPALSIGIVCRWPGSGLDGPTLLRQADRAMYEVKEAGGGRWRVWHGEHDDDF